MAKLEEKGGSKVLGGESSPQGGACTILHKYLARHKHRTAARKIGMILLQVYLSCTFQDLLELLRCAIFQRIFVLDRYWEMWTLVGEKSMFILRQPRYYWSESPLEGSLCITWGACHPWACLRDPEVPEEFHLTILFCWYPLDCCKLPPVPRLQFIHHCKIT